eukprot:XP_024303054.1 grainyhead-like protein 2 homolog isoform X3 [Homo sapiens]
MRQKRPSSRTGQEGGRECAPACGPDGRRGAGRPGGAGAAGAVPHSLDIPPSSPLPRLPPPGPPPHCLATFLRCPGGKDGSRTGGTHVRPRVRASAGREGAPATERFTRAPDGVCTPLELAALHAVGRHLGRGRRDCVGRAEPSRGALAVKAEGSGRRERWARVLPVPDRHSRRVGEPQPARPEPPAGHWARSGRVLTASPLAGPRPRKALCEPGEVGPGRAREGAGGGSRGLSRDSAGTLPSPSSRARPGLGTGCVLLEVRGAALLLSPVTLPWRCGHPEGTFLKVSRRRGPVPQGRGPLGLSWRSGGDPSQVEGPRGRSGKALRTCSGVEGKD